MPRIDNSQRVVVTGLGVVSSIGIGKDKFWKNLLNGTSGISKISSFDTKALNSKYGGEILNFDPTQFIDEKNISEYGKASQFAIAAAKLALQDAALSLSDEALRMMPILVGTTMGETQLIESIDSAWVADGEEKVSNQWISQYPGNTLAMSVARELDSTGLTVVLPTACSAGNYAIGYGYDLIRRGQSNIVLAGGSDAFSRIAYTGFSRLYAMSPDKCRPFDKNREGMLLGEGSGFILMESMEVANKRRARVYAEVLGYGLSSDASHMTIPTEDGMATVMKKALLYSNCDRSEVGYISAHGTGTAMNDKTECKAINRVFGDHAKNIRVSSIKSMLGHTMGAASALEAIACCLAIFDSKIPPTINYVTRDEECDINCIPNQAEKKQITIAMNNSFAFGGNNACLILKNQKLNRE